MLLKIDLLAHKTKLVGARHFFSENRGIHGDCELRCFE